MSVNPLHPGVIQGKNVTIEEPVTLGTNITLGDHVIIKIGAIIDDHVVIGDYTVVDTLCLIQDYVSIGASSHLGYNSTIDPRAIIGNKVAVGRNALLSTPLLISDGCRIDDEATLLEGVQLGTSTFIGRSAILGRDVKVGMPSTEENLRTRRRRQDIASQFDTVISADAIVGIESIMGRYCHIGPRTLLASQNILGQAVIILGGQFGINNTIESGTTFGNLSSLASNIQIGQNTFFGDGTTILRDTILQKGNKFGNKVNIARNVVIGEANSFGSSVQIGQNTIIGNSNSFTNQIQIQQDVIMGDNITMQNDSIIYPNTVIESNSQILSNISVGVDPLTDTPADSSSNVGVIVGAVVTVIAIIASVSAFILWYRRKTRQSIEHFKPMPEGYTSDVFLQAADEEQIHLRDMYREMDTDIPPEILYKQEIIGQGSFGKVYRGVLYDNKQFSAVAIKELQDASSENTIQLLDEATLMRRLNHPCIVACIGVCKEEAEPGDPEYVSHAVVRHDVDSTENSNVHDTKRRSITSQSPVNFTRVSVVLEYLPSGDLKEYLETNNINMSEKLWYITQMARGMAYLEREGIVHRDLAARNCMLGSPTTQSLGFNSLKVSDFGLSREIRNDKNYYTMTHEGKVPARWLPPESYRYLRFSSKSDVWSFGVTAWEIFTNGKIPYGDMNLAVVLENLERNELRLDNPDVCPDDVFQDLMLHTWEHHPDNRPTFQELMYISADKMKSYSDMFCDIREMTDGMHDLEIVAIDADDKYLQARHLSGIRKTSVSIDELDYDRLPEGYVSMHAGHELSMQLKNVVVGKPERVDLDRTVNESAYMMNGFENDDIDMNGRNNLLSDSKLSSDVLITRVGQQADDVRVPSSDSPYVHNISEIATESNNMYARVASHCPATVEVHNELDSTVSYVSTKAYSDMEYVDTVNSSIAKRTRQKPNTSPSNV
eukprot:CFRG0219T1